MYYNLSLIALAVLICACVAQDENGADIVESVLNATEINQDNVPFTTETNRDAVPDTTEINRYNVTETIATESIVCGVCDCGEILVDCRDRGIRKFFATEELTDLKNQNMIDLDLSQNPLNVLNLIPVLPIHKLNLSRSDISVIEAGAFRNLQELGSLDLSWNELSTSAVGMKIFEGPFFPDKGRRPFLNMRNLSLAYNDIHALPKDIFIFMADLRLLDLSGNPLQQIDQVTMGALSDLKLRDLRLAGCELEALPEGLLRRQRRLERLDLSDNKFTTVPAVLSETVSLVYLNFDKNALTKLEIGNAISNLTRLQELHICKHTKLQSIGPRALSGLEALETLYITNNPKLTTIDSEFLTWVDDDEVERWPMLEELYLNNNNLSTISSDYLSSWAQLRRVDFTGNPYVCDCGNQWMVEVLVPLISRTTDNMTVAKMICKKPSEMRGLSFGNLLKSNKTLKCVKLNAMTEDPGPDMAILLGVMIGIFVAFPLVLINVLLWKKGYFARCRRRYQSPRLTVSYYEEDDAF